MKTRMFIAIGGLLLLTAVSGFSQTPTAIERELAGYLDKLVNSGSYSGNYDEIKVTENNKLLRDRLIRYGKRSDVLKFGFPKLKDKLYIATSRDGRLRIYSWDEETGGTMHDFDNVFQYQGKSGKVYTWTRSNTAEGDAGSFYSQIFQADTDAGPIYLAVSNSIASTSLSGQSIESMMITGEKFQPDAKMIRTGSGLKSSVGFSFDFFSVVDHPERPVKLFFFDEAKRSFRFPIVIQDKKTPQGRVTKRFITYHFDGKYFERLK